MHPGEMNSLGASKHSRERGGWGERVHSLCDCPVFTPMGLCLRLHWESGDWENTALQWDRAPRARSCLGHGSSLGATSGVVPVTMGIAG